MATREYLNEVGLGQVWEKIKNLTSKKTSSIPFGQVDDTSTATVFTATIDGVDELRDGVCVYLKNGVVTSASGWTLNINDLGAKPVYQTQAAASRTTTVFNINYTGLFVYNSSRVSGGCWDYFYGYNSDTNTTAYQIRANQTINKMYAALTRYKICFSRPDGSLLPSTATSNSIATSKTLTTDYFNPFGTIYYYSTTTDVAADESPSASYMWIQYPSIDLRYSFNTGTTLIAKEPVYIKCEPQDDGTVVLAGNDCIVQTISSYNDGYVYIYLGKAYDTYRISLELNHPVYYYSNGGIRLWTNYITYGYIPIYNGGMLVNNDGDNNGFIVEYDETSLIKASATGVRIHNVVTPTNNTDAANKQYVDEAISGLTSSIFSFYNAQGVGSAIVGTTSVGDETVTIETGKTYNGIYSELSNGCTVYFTYYDYFGQARINADDSVSAICFKSNDVDHTDGIKIILQSSGAITASRFYVPVPEDDENILNLLTEYGYSAPLSDIDGNVITDVDRNLILG